MHAWAIMAETILGRGDRAYEYYRQILPNVASAVRGEDLYVNEPYCFSSTTLAEPDARAGEGDMPWFSGTVTWMYLVGTQYILGVRPVLGGLLIDPCIPAAWDGFSVRRKYKNVLHKITVKNPRHVCKGVKSITVAGRKIQGCVLPQITGTAEVEVEVVLG
jgi:cellobiose phosphorylase